MPIDGSTSLSIGFIILLLGFAFTCASFYASRKKDNAEDVKKSVEANVKINMKLDQLCQNTNDIKSDIRYINTEVKEIRDTQIIHDQNIKSIWHEIRKLQKSEGSEEK